MYESADLLIALQSYERMPTNPPTLEYVSMLCAKSVDPTTRRLLFTAMRQHLRGNETVRRLDQISIERRSTGRVQTNYISNVSRQGISKIRQQAIYTTSRCFYSKTSHISIERRSTGRVHTGCVHWVLMSLRVCRLVEIRWTGVSLHIAKRIFFFDRGCPVS